MLVLLAAVYLEIGALIFLGTESMCLVEAIYIRKNTVFLLSMMWNFSRDLLLYKYFMLMESYSW